MLELLAPGHVICDRYRILGVLGKGGMGTVFKAEDTALKRLVALKVITVRNALTDDEADGTDPQREERFLREASLSAQIHHPNVVTVFDYGRGEHGVETFCYIAMQLLQGESLGGRLSKRPGGLPAPAALAIVTQVARGLRAAHQRGLVHRDLKPENIMLMPGEDGEEIACLIDFGLAKDTSSAKHQELTEAGMVLGTPEYMAPEQVQAMEIDARADLYALGIVLYECLCGRPPFLHDNAFRIAAMHLRVEPPPMHVIAGRAPPSPALQALVRGLLEKRRDARIQTAEEVLRILRDLPEARPLPEQAAAESMSLSTGSHFALTALLARPANGPDNDAVDSQAASRRQLRSTGQPTIWVLAGDPAVRNPAVLEALGVLRGTTHVLEIPADQRESLAASLTGEDASPPWLVMFGGMHVILEDPLLAALARVPDVSRLMVSTHASSELLDAAINFCGLDHHLTLPAVPEQVRDSIDRMVQRSGAARRYYDDLRMRARRSAPPAPPCSQLRRSGATSPA
jgi:serine/threonine protein kinase